MVFQLLPQPSSNFDEVQHLPHIDLLHFLMGRSNSSYLFLQNLQAFLGIAVMLGPVMLVVFLAYSPDSSGD